MTIEDFLKENKTYNVLAKGSTKKAQEQLYENEKLLYALNANVDIVNTNEENFSNRNKMTAGALKLKNKLNWVVVITTERIFFCNSVLGQTNMKEIRIADITSMDESTAILKMGELRIKGLTETFVISIANEKIMNEIKKYINVARKNEK